MVKQTLQKVASPPRMDCSIVFPMWRQCAPPFNTWFLWPTQVCPKASSRSVHPFLHSPVSPAKVDEPMRMMYTDKHTERATCVAIAASIRCMQCGLKLLCRCSSRRDETGRRRRAVRRYISELSKTQFTCSKISSYCSR